MRAIVPFVLQVFQVIALRLTICQSGGSSTFGYDASSACGKPYSRTGRMHREDLPCDLRLQNWCTNAGSSYPWHAVRRFVQENHGLMRRMYGDESYINVLRAEFDKNDIELKYDNHHHNFADESRQFQYEDDDYNFDGGLRSSAKFNKDEYESRGFISRSFNDPIAKRLDKLPKLSEYTRPHFKPTERTVTSSVAPSTTTSSTSTSATVLEASSSSTTMPAAITEVVNDQPFVTPIFPLNITKIIDNSTMNNASMMPPSVTVTQIAKEQNFSINEIPELNDKINENLRESVEAILLSKNDTTTEETTTAKPAVTIDMPMESLLTKEEEKQALDAAINTTVYETMLASNSHEQQQQFKRRPEYRPSAETSSTGGQLYQDVAAKDQQEQPVLKLRGVNACPVKEEVVAPFWANNTRGEVLALLNIYPFEQYVHWETCTHENKQMYCRDGCRCEQQYRLHRLLAYDPNNECRGIFSDWFKFPSCCVCRCYDLPLEFRVTSRSPRIFSQKRRIKVQAPRNRYT